jgi:hypothetical protein|tara:strand:- start:1221 stop:1322 length:102 start_codon:yes stop_codon:yes gene_type:complete
MWFLGMWLTAVVGAWLMVLVGSATQNNKKGQKK